MGRVGPPPALARLDRTPRLARPVVWLLCLGLTGLIVLLFPGASSAQAAQGIRGTLASEGEPVPGVTVVVEQDGETVEELETDETGSFFAEVEPGDYTVSLDPDTLPEGVAVREGFEEREVTVRPGAIAPALFPLGEGDRQTASTFDQFLRLLVGGLQFGLVIAMAAIGLSLIFGTTGLTNFAHGELVTLGAIVAFFVNTTLGLHLIPATLIAMVVGALYGSLLDRGLWRPLRARGTGLIAALVISIGLAILMRYTFLYLIGGQSRSYEQYVGQQPIEVGPVAIPPRDIIIMALSALILTLVGLALIKTRIGKATRAVADNPALAAASGIDVERVINIVWTVGTALAALGGVFLALSIQVSYLLGWNILLLLFAGVILGGLGTAFGALVGSIVIGVFTQVSTLVIPAELQNVGALVVLMIILVIRPQGILGRAERVG